MSAEADLLIAQLDRFERSTGRTLEKLADDVGEIMAWKIGHEYMDEKAHAQIVKDVEAMLAEHVASAEEKASAPAPVTTPASLVPARPAAHAKPGFFEDLFSTRWGQGVAVAVVIYLLQAAGVNVAQKINDFSVPNVSPMTADSDDGDGDGYGPENDSDAVGGRY